VPGIAEDLDFPALERRFSATAAWINALNALASSASPSRMSMARRVFPSRLELKSFRGSFKEAPRAKVSFTTFAYVSPVQTIPWCDQTGTPSIAFDGFLHFRSSAISRSASKISARMRASVSPRQSPRGRLRSPMSRESTFPAARCVSAPGLALLPAFGGDLDLVADLRGLIAREALLIFGFALLLAIIHSLLRCRRHR
jgi:hypothetical protein